MISSKRFSRKQKLYGVIILILAFFYGFKFVGNDRFVIPTRSRINEEKQKVQQLQAQLSNLEKSKAKSEYKKQRLSALTRGYWPFDGKALTNKIQRKIQRLGNRTGVTLKKVGAPKIIDVSDHVRAIDVTVSTTTSIKDFSNFIREVDNHHPKLIWHNCVVRPNHTKNPTAVNVSGKVRAYILAESVSEYIQSKSL